MIKKQHSFIKEFTQVSLTEIKFLLIIVEKNSLSLLKAFTKDKRRKNNVSATALPRLRFKFVPPTNLPKKE